MKSSTRMIFSIGSVVIIILVSLVVAWVCFNLLESSAEGTFQTWKLGGAFAGFVVTATLMASVARQLYKEITSDQIEDYKKQVQDLQNKLLRGATCPQGYVIDLDEKRKIVLSRPSSWVSQYNVFFQYKEGRTKENDSVAANFNVISFGLDDIRETFENVMREKFDPENVDIEKLYTANVDGVKEINRQLDSNSSIYSEYINVDGHKSAKYTSNRVVADPSDASKKVKLVQSGVLTYVPKLKSLYIFTFTDNEEDYLRSSETFSNVLSSVRFLI
jgi:hypothetical protein